MKKITSNIACFFSGVIIASTVGAIAANYTATENTFPIKVNGQDVQMEGYNIEGSTYFKLRDIGDKMGFDVGFENGIIYVGEVPKRTTAPISTNNNIAYYSAPYSWCPDFGKYTGTPRYSDKKSILDSENVVYYSYKGNMADCEKYALLLLEMGFEQEDALNFRKDGHSICMKCRNYFDEELVIISLWN